MSNERDVQRRNPVTGRRRGLMWSDDATEVAQACDMSEVLFVESALANKTRCPPRVSVIIPTFRRPALLARCLAAVMRQTLDDRDFEVLVAEDGGESEMLALVAAANALRPGVVCHHVTCPRDAAGINRGPAAARNAAFRFVRGGIVAFTDDDTIPQPDWLASGLASFADRPEVLAVAGRVEVPLPCAPTDYEWNESRLETTEFVTANCFCRREAMIAVGAFDERFRMAWREDSDIHFALLELAHRRGRNEEVVRDPGAVVRHPVRPAPWGVSLPLQRKARYNALLFKKHRRLYRERIQPHPPYLYYAILVALLVGIFGRLSSPVMGAAGVVLWITLTAVLFLRRIHPLTINWRNVTEMAVTSVFIPPLAIYWRLRGAIEFRVVFF